MRFIRYSQIYSLHLSPELCFYTDDIDLTYKHFIENNVECLSEPQHFNFTSQGFGESKAFYFKDPDGIILEMMQAL